MSITHCSLDSPVVTTFCAREPEAVPLPVVPRNSRVPPVPCLDGGLCQDAPPCRACLCRVVPGHVAGVLLAKPHAVRGVVPDPFSREVHRPPRFVSRLPNAERDNASVVELAD